LSLSDCVVLTNLLASSHCFIVQSFTVFTCVELETVELEDKHTDLLLCSTIVCSPVIFMGKLKSRMSKW